MHWLSTKFNRLIAPPVFDDAEKTRVARWLHITLLLLILTLTVITISLPFSWMDAETKRQFAITQSAMLVMFIVSLFLVHKGFVGFTALLTVGAIFFGTLYSHFFTYRTIRDLSVIGYFVLVPLTGLIFRRRGMWLAVALSVATLIVTFLLESNGLIEPASHIIATIDDLLFLLICLALNTGLALAILTETEESAKLARESAANLAVTNRELNESQIQLRQTRDDLEIRVIERTEALNQANDKLRAEIAERTSIAHNLRIAKEEAEAANQAKSAFLANMSHEIRTPMNGVVAIASLLRDTQLTTEQREFVQIIQRSSDALLTLIDDILSYSKIESGKLSLAHMSFDLRGCVTEVIELLASSASEKQLELAYFVDASVPVQLIGDAARVRQILINLISNALKFTEKGYVYVNVRSTALEQDYHEVHFTVTDTGIGISPENAEIVFESFSQVDISNTRRFGGAGLGLAISRQLSEQMGGRIWIDSEVGQGSNFHFTIVAPAVADGSAPYERNKNPMLDNRRVLILSSHDLNRDIMAKYVTLWGLSPIVTHSIEDTLLRFENGDMVDIAVLDLDTANASDLEIINVLRSRAPSLPIILYIALSERESREQLRSYPSMMPLYKPIKPSALLEAFEYLLGTPEDSMLLVSTPKSVVTEVKPLNILLVEDNLINQKVTRRLLLRLGYDTDLASDGVEAVNAVQRGHYDVIFMDVQMPKMDGLEATRRIRSNTSLSKQPYIIALTAAAMEDERQACIQAGMDIFVAKPVRFQEISAILDKYWSLR